MKRLVELAPVFAALMLHAVAHGRWLLCAPVMVGLAWAVMKDVRIDYTPARLLLAGAVGLGVGSAMLWVSEPPTAPFPPSIFGPLCGALVGLAVLCGLGSNRYFAWTYACLLVALSMRVREMQGVGWVLGALVLSVLLVAFLEGGLPRTGLRAAVGFGVFVVLLLGLSLVLARTIWASEGMLGEAVYRMTSGISSGGGSEFQSEVDIRAVVRSPRGSERPLLVLSGQAPARLRARVFDEFDGSRWRTSKELAETRLELPSGGTEAERVLAMTVLAPVGPWLPAPAGTRAVEGLRPEVQGGWVLKARELEGNTLALRTGAEELLPPEAAQGASLTALPEALEAELRPLAEELTRGASTPRERARALEAYFHEHFEYSLNVDLRGEGNPLTVLVREKRAAYCTYFASAMAALLRTLDVPARVVGGFAPEERNPLTGATLVRERDAHAWVEVYLADEGRFVAFDPTPWRSRDETLGLSQEQRGFFGNLTGAVGTWLRQMGAGLRYQPLALARAVVGSPVFAVLVAGVLLWRLRRSRWEGRTKARRVVALGTKDVQLAALYARYLKTLKRRAGLVPRPSETDDELLSRLRTARGDAVADMAAEFLAHYRQARYRGEPGDPASWGALVERLDATLREAVTSPPARAGRESPG
ncbi:transglutaminase domain-containing protein [Archangium minus]|uniref:Transglutaminase domain-containing protein n=1 Tax=Archangium minus TaxID=83450 RepID=A0ABY9X8U8_9BACT|nr:transglutaminase domain-containing protein [Archangium minus]